MRDDQELSQEWEGIMPLVTQFSNKYAKKYPVPIEEFISLGHEIFLRCYDKGHRGNELQKYFNTSFQNRAHTLAGKKVWWLESTTMDHQDSAEINADPGLGPHDTVVRREDKLAIAAEISEILRNSSSATLSLVQEFLHPGNRTPDKSETKVQVTAKVHSGSTVQTIKVQCEAVELHTVKRALKQRYGNVLSCSYSEDDARRARAAYRRLQSPDTCKSFLRGKPVYRHPLMVAAYFGGLDLFEVDGAIEECCEVLSDAVWGTDDDEYPALKSREESFY